MPSLNLERDTEISVLKRQLEKREIELARRDAVAAIRASGGSAAILLPTMLAAAVVSDTPNGSEVTYRHGPRKVGAADFVKALADDGVV